MRVPATVEGSNSSRVLIVDDEPALGRSYKRILARSGFVVRVVTDGTAAVHAVQSDEFDVVLSDIDMPGLNGIELLRTVRQHDLDLPVVLMTGNPTVGTAIQALEYGALRYLIKPIEAKDLVEHLHRASTLGRMAALKRESLRLLAQDQFQVGDRAGLEAAFARALGSLTMVYQPIVSWSRRQIFAMEALLRSNESTLPTAGALLDAAERLSCLSLLGRRIRARVAATAYEHPDVTFFVNLHPSDLLDDELHAPHAPLSRVAGRVVLEITERDSLDKIADVRARIASLRSLGYRIALDDLGAGYAGLSAFAQLEPDVVKVDMSLVRDIHQHPTKRKLVHSIASICTDLSLTLIVEGVEVAAERDALLDLGCDLLQGYLFARPAYPPPAVRW